MFDSKLINFVEVKNQDIVANARPLISSAKSVEFFRLRSPPLLSIAWESELSDLIQIISHDVDWPLFLFSIQMRIDLLNYD